MSDKRHIHIHGRQIVAPIDIARQFEALRSAYGRPLKNPIPGWDRGVRGVNEFLAPIEAVTPEMIQAWGKPRFNQLFNEFYASDREPWELSIWLREEYCRSCGIGVDLTGQPSPALDPPPPTCSTLTQVDKPATGFVSWVYALARRVVL